MLTQRVTSEKDTNCEIDENGECNQGISLKHFENQV
jgi:hypothetical protein